MTTSAILTNHPRERAVGLSTDQLVRLIETSADKLARHRGERDLAIRTLIAKAEELKLERAHPVVLAQMDDEPVLGTTVLVDFA
jgi:hypothetical protein